MQQKILRGVAVCAVGMTSVSWAEQPASPPATLGQWVRSCSEITLQDQRMASMMDMNCAANAVRYCDSLRRMDPNNACVEDLTKAFEEMTADLLPILKAMRPEKSLQRRFLSSGLAELETDGNYDCPEEVSRDQCPALSAGLRWYYARDLSRLGK